MLWQRLCAFCVFHFPPSLVQLNLCFSEAIPLAVVGLSLSLVFPSAYVSFPIMATDNLKKQPRQRMRIVAGGAWHNLVLYAICLAVGAAGIGGLWGWVGYEDTKATGRVVLGLDGVANYIRVVAIPLTHLSFHRIHRCEVICQLVQLSLSWMIHHLRLRPTRRICGRAI